MIFNCGLPRDVKRARKEAAEKRRLEQWHPFFCLWPRRINDSTCVWLETIQRKGTYQDYGYHGEGWDWDYRLGTVKETFR